VPERLPQGGDASTIDYVEVLACIWSLSHWPSKPPDSRRGRSGFLRL